MSLLEELVAEARDRSANAAAATRRRTRVDEFKNDILPRLTLGVVTGVQMSLLSSKNILDMSVGEVTDATLSKRALPTVHGVNNPFMGTTDKSLHCAQCGCDVMRCSGHYGHIRLAEPVYHQGYLKTVVKILRTICIFCSRIRIANSDPKFILARGDLSALTVVCKSRGKCVHCYGPQPSYTVVGSAIERVWPSSTPFASEAEREWAMQPFVPAFVHRVLTCITDDDVTSMGFKPHITRPESMIIEILLVPPPAIRPYNSTLSNGSADEKTKGQAEATLRLHDIVKTNELLKKEESRVGYLIPLRTMDLLAQLQVKVSSYLMQLKVASNKKLRTNMICEVLLPSITAAAAAAGSVPTAIEIRKRNFVGAVAMVSNGGSGGVAVSNGKDSMSGRLKGKHGRFRGNLNGKRADMSSRSVISPDVDLDVDKLRVPYVIANKLAIPIVVTDFNIASLQARLRFPANDPQARGLKTLYSANSCDRIEIETLDAETRLSLVLHIGDTVERPLQDGDPVIFNRQPSLHTGSMMVHYVKLGEGFSFGLPLATRTPYNADFDGDEMNLHVPNTAAEMISIMKVACNVVSNNGKPVVAPVMDSLVGWYLLTQKDCMLTREQMCNLVMHIHYPHGLDDGANSFHYIPEPEDPVNQLWSGRQLFSLCLPRGTYFRRTVPNGENVVIEDGVLISGVVDKRVIGTQHGNLIHVLFNEFGGDITVRVVSDLQRIPVKYLTHIRGFSIGLEDCAQARNAARESVNALLNNASEYHDRIMSTLHGAEAVETHLKNTMGRVLVDAANIVQDAMRKNGVAQRNSFNVMVFAGSKGSTMNLAQISATVAQQSVSGRRLKTKNGEPTLSCFEGGVHTMESGGFVRSCYYDGLNPEEVFMHAQGGREGLSDTSVKTAETGAMQRRMRATTESACVAEDMSVRDGRGRLIQTQYGGDGLNPAMVETVNFPHFDDFHTKPRRLLIPSEEVANLLRSYGLVARVRDELLQPFVTGRRILRAGKSRFHWDSVFESPFHAPRLLQRAISTLEVDQSTDLRAYWTLALDILKESCDRILSKTLPRPFSVIMKGYVHATVSEYIFRLRDRISLPQLSAFLRLCVLQTYRCRAQAGDSVGPRAAMSIGESTTQTTLNTFHAAGRGNAHVNMGVPRLVELLNCSTDIKTPSMHVYLKEPGRESVVARALESRNLSHFVEHVHLEQTCTTRMEHECRVCVVYELRKIACVRADISPLDIADCLVDFLGPIARVCASDDSSEMVWSVRVTILDARLVFRCADMTSYLDFLDSDSASMSDAERMAMRVLSERFLLSVPILGLEGVTRAVVVDHSYFDYDDDRDMGVKKTERMIETEGTDLSGVVSLPFVDARRTLSNHPVEMNGVFGLCAGYRVWLSEMMAVTNMSDKVNDHHVRLLADTMFGLGMLAANRHGVIAHSGSVFAQASFEEAAEVCLNGAIYGAHDPMRGVTENIIVGNMCPVGTGRVTILTADPRDQSDPRNQTGGDSWIRELASIPGARALNASVAASNRAPDAYYGDTPLFEKKHDKPLLTMELLGRFLPLPRSSSNFAEFKSNSSGGGTKRPSDEASLLSTLTNTSRVPTLSFLGTANAAAAAAGASRARLARAKRGLSSSASAMASSRSSGTVPIVELRSQAPDVVRRFEPWS